MLPQYFRNPLPGQIKVSCILCPHRHMRIFCPRPKLPIYSPFVRKKIFYGPSFVPTYEIF
jgi:hypothetical protein